MNYRQFIEGVIDNLTDELIRLDEQESSDNWPAIEQRATELMGKDKSLDFHNALIKAGLEIFTILTSRGRA